MIEIGNLTKGGNTLVSGLDLNNMHDFTLLHFRICFPTEKQLLSNSIT
jgi:hypothetical protein